MKAILQGFYQKEHFWLRLGVVLLAVFGMGFALSLLLLVDMGTDPCSMMSKAISAKIGMSFGNWQALMNTVLLVLVVIFGGRNLGFGTLANMFLIGYFVDFFTWIWNRVLPADFFTTLPVRSAVLIPSVILFILTAALYMDVDMGTAPYDAIPIIISGHLPKVPFKVIPELFFERCNTLLKQKGYFAFTTFGRDNLPHTAGSLMRCIFSRRRTSAVLSPCNIR